MKWIIALLIFIGGALIWLSPQKKREPLTTRQSGNIAVNPRRPSTNASIPPNLNTSPGLDLADAPEGIDGKLNRLYGYCLSSPNPGYSNVLETMKAITIKDPTDSDLFKDASTFVALRTEIAAHIQSAEADLQGMREWLIRKNPTPEAQSNALKRFEANRPTAVDDLLQTDEAVKRIFAERFSERYGINQELAIERLSSLTLPDPGPELWLRCDETVSPYPDPPKPTNAGPREFLQQFRQ